VQKNCHEQQQDGKIFVVLFTAFPGLLQGMPPIYFCVAGCGLEIMMTENER
jgi:hypothetical protein